jgi:mannose-6-phosphate isomerase-like protein (cupin superfamily)
MLIKKEQARQKKNSNDCTVWEYEYPISSFSFATALITGRYPEEKRSVNLECAELYYVISGSGSIHTDKGDFLVNQGDSYYFEKGEAYWVEGNNLLIALINVPGWRFEQYKIVI